MDMFKAFAIYFGFFYVYYIFNSEYPKKLEVTSFFINSEAATGGVP